MQDVPQRLRVAQTAQTMIFRSLRSDGRRCLRGESRDGRENSSYTSETRDRKAAALEAQELVEDECVHFVGTRAGMSSSG